MFQMHSKKMLQLKGTSETNRPKVHHADYFEHTAWACPTTRTLNQ